MGGGIPPGGGMGGILGSKGGRPNGGRGGGGGPRIIPKGGGGRMRGGGPRITAFGGGAGPRNLTVIKGKANTSLSPLFQVTVISMDIRVPEYHLTSPTCLWEASVVFSW